MEWLCKSCLADCQRIPSKKDNLVALFEDGILAPLPYIPRTRTIGVQKFDVINTEFMA